MRGQRLYVIKVVTTDGRTLTSNFWSHNKKGSTENFCDGIYTIYRDYKIESKDIESWEISYAQTSLLR